MVWMEKQVPYVVLSGHTIPQNTTECSKEKSLSDLVVLQSDKFGDKGTPQFECFYTKQKPLVMASREETKYCLDLQKCFCFVC